MSHDGMSSSQYNGNGQAHEQGTQHESQIQNSDNVTGAGF